jgi:hypothetical protein
MEGAVASRSYWRICSRAPHGRSSWMLGPPSRGFGNHGGRRFSGFAPATFEVLLTPTSLWTCRRRRPAAESSLALGPGRRDPRGTFPLPTARSRPSLVAAMIPTSALRHDVPPTRRMCLSSGTRSSLACRSGRRRRSRRASAPTACELEQTRPRRPRGTSLQFRDLQRIPTDPVSKERRRGPFDLYEGPESDRAAVRMRMTATARRRQP